MKTNEGTLRIRRPKARMLAGTICLFLLPAADGQKPSELTEHLHVRWVANWELHSSGIDSKSDVSDHITIELDATAHGTAPPGTPPWQINPTITACHYTVSGNGSIAKTTKDEWTKGSWTWGLVEAPACPSELMILDNGSFSVAQLAIDEQKIEPRGLVESGGKGMPTQSLPAGLMPTFGLIAVEGVHTVVTTKSFYDQLSGTFDPNSKAFTKSGKASGNHSGSWSEGETTGSVEAEYSLNFNQQPEDVEAVMIPDQGYPDWIPQAGADEDTAGNWISIQVKLQKKGQPGKTPDRRTAQFKFTLADVSHEPGVSGNWPPQPKKGSDGYPPDLKIVPQVNPSLKVSNDGQSAESSDKVVDSTVNLTSFDWAAYGKVKVTATLDDGTQQDAYVQPGPNLQGGPGVTALPIPQDDNGNYIADALDRKLGFSTAPGAIQPPPSPPIATFLPNLLGVFFHGWQSQPAQAASAPAPDSDDDARPAGDGTPGDGLSYFEEARGFQIQGIHKTTDPSKKDLFVFNPDHLNLSLFTRRSGIVVHQLAEKEFCDQCDSASANHNVVNYVTQDGGHHRLGNVHVVKISSVELSNGAGGISSAGTPPGQCEEIKIDESVAWTLPQLLMDIAHELAHCANVPHHGDSDYRASQIRYVANNKPITNSDLDIGNDVIPRVAAAGGEESGRQECIMRYNHAALLYEHQGGSIKWRKILLPSAKETYEFYYGEKYRPWEPAGILFCDSKKGTGVAGRKAGDATVGNCKGRFCVNDVHGCTTP